MEPAKKVGRQSVHVHILSACLPFCQRISRSWQAEPKVFTIVCVTHLLLIMLVRSQQRHMKEKPRQTAAREVDRPEIFQKPCRQNRCTQRRLLNPKPLRSHLTLPSASSAYLQPSALDVRRSPAQHLKRQNLMGT